MRSVLWHPYDGPGAERAVFEPTPDGHRIAGTSLLMVGGEPHEIRYTVLTDGGWRTLTVGAHVQGPGNDRRLALHCDGDGTWTVGDEPVIDLYGATDIDLAWTPATNTIPIRRLQLDAGAEVEVTVAYVAFPEHAVMRRRQRYTFLGEGIYRYQSDGFAVDLSVDEHGVVTDYPGGWRAATAH